MITIAIKINNALGILFFEKIKIVLDYKFWCILKKMAKEVDRDIVQVRASKNQLISRGAHGLGRPILTGLGL